MTDVLRIDASYTAQLDRPAFVLQARWADFASAAFDRFSPYIRPEEVTFESSGGQPSDFAAKCDLVDLGVAIRFRLTNLQLWTRNVEFVRKGMQFLELITKALAILDDLQARITTKSHTFAYGIHWRMHPDQGGHRTLLKQWVATAPEGFEVSGASFATGDGRTTMLVEPSLLFPESEAIFVRVSCEIPGATPIAEANALSTARARQALRVLGLELMP